MGRGVILPLGMNEHMISATYTGKAFQAWTTKDVTYIQLKKILAYVVEIHCNLLKYHNNWSTCTSLWFSGATGVQLIQNWFLNAVYKPLNNIIYPVITSLVRPFVTNKW